MRDGIELATTVYLPKGEGPFPIVLVRTAYNRAPVFNSYFPEHGMALVVQDVRGRYGSDGAFVPFTHEAADGASTLSWLQEQPWCNGHVGMYGDSYLAATQFAVAPSGHPALAALVPRFMSVDLWKRAYYRDGAFSLALSWSWLCFEVSERISRAPELELYDLPELLSELPLIDLDRRAGGSKSPAWRDYVLRARHDDAWAETSLRGRFSEVRTPMLLIGGWYDYYAADAAQAYQQLVDEAPDSELASAHRLLIGPWTHGLPASSTLGELDFGSAALEGKDATQRWLAAHLTGGDPADVQAAPVRYFVMGTNTWREAESWPPSGTDTVPFYLNGSDLTREPPTGNGVDIYLYDPEHPVASRGGNHSIGPWNPGLHSLVLPGPYDQRAAEARPDVLTYTTDILEQDLEVTGAVTMCLFASSSTRDTDFVVKLCDVHPDGRSLNITEGVIRARFRDDIYEKPKLLEPGKVYRFDIDLQVTSNCFMAGHRIRVSITSSNFPLWDRNLNTGGDPATESRWEVAEQHLYRSAEYPSHILLPVMTDRSTSDT